MLAEEAHHMFVGYTGVQRIVQRTCEAMSEAGIDDPYDAETVRALGVIDLPTIQRKTNLHFSLTLDLFGSEESTNAANFFNAGVKGRYHEERLEDDHQLLAGTYPVTKLVDGELHLIEVPALNALNARLRDDFIGDCSGGVNRWNRVVADVGIDFEIRLPHIAFNRAIGEFSGIYVSPAGNVLTEDQWASKRGSWLPDSDDEAFIQSLMQPELDPGKFGGWIAPPTKGVHNMPEDFLYVKLP
jgi:benzoyl-CoA 2,3-dioxygenase component B